MKRKAIAWILAVTMVVTFVPMISFGVETEGADEVITSEDQVDQEGEEEPAVEEEEPVVEKDVADTEEVAESDEVTNGEEEQIPEAPALRNVKGEDESATLDKQQFKQVVPVTSGATSIHFGSINSFADEIDGMESVNINGSIWAYHNGQDYYIVNIDGDSIILPEDCSMLFNMSTATEISFDDTVDASNVTNMNSMFYYCENLQTVDVGSFNTESLVNMSGMFSNCSALTALDITNFNTENVTDLNNVFNSCSELTTLDLSNFNTSNVTSMQWTFAYCTKLKTIDLKGLNTKKVTTMYGLFSNCSSLTELDLSSFDTSSLTACAFMFNSCSSLTTIYVGDTWDVSSIVGTGSNLMFTNCTSIVGEKGTVYDADVVDNTYARIDGGADNPGYLSSLGSNPDLPSGECGENLTWMLNSEGTLTISGTGEMQACNWYTAPWYEYRESINTVVLEEGVTATGEGAFENCINLTEVVFPESLERLAPYTFIGCTGLQTITIPASIHELEESVFRNCSGMTTIDIPANITTIGPNAFYGCSGLETVYVPDTVVSIGENAFWGVENAKIYIKKGSYIEEYLSAYWVPGATYTCRYGHVWNERYTVETPPTEEEDGEESIHCSVCDVVKEGSVRPVSYEDAVLDYGTCGDDIEWSLTYSGKLTISGTGDMKDCGYGSSPWYDYLPLVKTVIVEEGVNSIGRGAFENHYNIETVILPSSITMIYGSAFDGCKKIKSISIPGNVKRIDGSAFSGCTGLEEIVIPNSVNTINGGAFWGCTGLKSVTIPDSVFLIGDRAFCDVTATFFVKKNSYADTWLKEDDKTIQYTCDFGHVWNEEYTVDTPATCTEEGSESIHCSVCDMIQDDSVKVIEKKEHTYGEWQTTTEPTCTTAGQREQVCSGCGDTIKETIPALGHDWEKAYTEDLAATCTEDGIESQHCSRCDAVQNEKVIPAKGHDFGEWVEIEASSCENAGLEQHTCGNCGLVESKNLDPLGHDFEESYSIDQDATCTEDGSQSRHCTRCDAVADSQVIPATGHSYVETINDSTCTEAGEKIEKCSTCGDTITTVIAPKGHDMVHYDAVAATCIKDGNSAYCECSRCGRYFSDEEGTKEIEKDSWIIEAKGHTEVELPAVAATLTETGLTAGKKCSECGDILEEQKVIASPASSENYTVAAATYNGRAQQPVITVVDTNGDVIDASNYDVAYSNNVNAGTAAKAVITFKGIKYSGTVDDLTFKINKAAQRMTVKAVTKTLKAKKLKKKAQIVSAITVVRQGAVPTYRKLSGSAKLTVNAKTGKITVKKKTKKGTYKIKVRVISGATTNYNAAYRDVTVTVKVKK